MKSCSSSDSDASKLLPAYATIAAVNRAAIASNRVLGDVDSGQEPKLLHESPEQFSGLSCFNNAISPALLHGLLVFI